MVPKAWALALLFLLAGPPLAGCMGERRDEPPSPPAPAPMVRDPAEVWPLLSPAQYAPLPTAQVWVPSFDGERMDNVVYRPKTPDGVRVPVVINFSPYWGNLAPPANAGGDHFSQHLIQYFLPRGYAIVLSSVRGTGNSDGCFNLGGDVEKKDAAAVIEFFARQPWSNGNVSAAGKSYDGTTPQGVSTLDPPALKSLVPVSPISELYKYNYKGGLPYGGLHGATFNQRYPQTVGWTEGVPSTEDLCADYPVIAGTGLLTAATGDYTEYWQERDYSSSAAAAKAALFYIHGLQDWNVKPDHALPWLERYAGPKKVWLHQWTTEDDGGHVYPMRDDWNYTMLRFLDHTLKGIDTGLFEEPPVQIEDTAGRWRHESTYPPRAETATKLWLTSRSGDGALAPGPGAAGQRSFVDDGRRPDPAAGSAANQLLYTSAPMAQDVHLTGTPLLRITASSDRPVGKVAATLFAVEPNGNRSVVSWTGLNLRHREDVRQPKEVVPGQKYDLTLEFFPQETYVAAGTRLELALAGNAGVGSAGYLRFEEINTQARITFDENDDAYLEIPTVPSPQLVLEDPQPKESARCWAC